MTCHTCKKIYPQSIPGIHYFETWWKNSCQTCGDEFVVCSTECRFVHCQKCKRDIHIETILETNSK